MTKRELAWPRGLVVVASGLLGIAPSLFGGLAQAGGDTAISAEVSSAGISKDPDFTPYKKVCGACHGLSVVSATPRSYADWEDTVQKMIDRGAKGSDEDFEGALGYLYRNLTTINVNSADPDELQGVLGVSAPVAQAIISRRAERRFSDAAELKALPGADPDLIREKARLMYF